MAIIFTNNIQTVADASCKIDKTIDSSNPLDAGTKLCDGLINYFHWMHEKCLHQNIKNLTLMSKSCDKFKMSTSS